MGREGSHGGKDPRNGHVEVGSHQWGHGLLEESGSHGGHRHSSHGEVGFCHGNHHGEGCIHGMVHGGRSRRPDRIGEEQENGNGLGHGEYPVGSVKSVDVENLVGEWTHISNAGNADSLEFTAVKLFYCGLKIRSSLELNKASDLLAMRRNKDESRY